MRVSDLSKTENIASDTIRHYVRIRLLSPQKDSSGYHTFSPTDVKQLRFIRQARDLGFTLDDVRSILSEAGKGKSPCPVVRELIEPRLSEARRRLADMQALVERMEQAMQVWEGLPDCEPCGDHICHLIEGDASESPECGESCCEQ